MVDHVSIIMLRLFDLIQSLQIHEDFVSSDWLIQWLIDSRFQRNKDDYDDIKELAIFRDPSNANPAHVLKEARRSTGLFMVAPGHVLTLTEIRNRDKNPGQVHLTEN